VIQQLRGAFRDAQTHRFLIFDNDAIFSPEVGRSIRRFGIHPRRTAFQSPWQNGTAERFVGTVRRELLDHVVVLGEDHLRRLLREYIEYYNSERVHTSIGDAPYGRAVDLGLRTWPGSSAFLAWEVCTTDTPGLRLADDPPARARSCGRNARMNNGYRQA
jgi:transposase InsO family protein